MSPRARWRGAFVSSISVCVRKLAGAGVAPARAASARSASRTGAARGVPPMPGDAEGAKRTPLAALWEVRTRMGAQPDGCVRARSFPSRSLLGPTRSRASDRRSDKQPRSRRRNEVRRFAARASREPCLPASRTRACRPLPPPRSANASRGAERAGLCPAQCAPTSCEDATTGSASGDSRSGLVCALVHRLDALARPMSKRWSACCREPAQLAARARVAASRTDLACGGPGY